MLPSFSGNTSSRGVRNEASPTRSNSFSVTQLHVCIWLVGIESIGIKGIKDHRIVFIWKWKGALM